MPLPTRRTLMQSTVLAGAALAAPKLATAQATPAPASAPAKSDKPGLAVIGCGGIARYHGQYLPKYFNVVATADPDMGRAKSYAKDIGGTGEPVQDYRKVLERKDVDVVLIATPDHWHTKCCIDAMRAGKDVYCEKPLTLTIDEGRLLCRVTRETGRVLQVGSQQRSEEQFLTPVALVHAGRLGKIKHVTVAIGPTPVKEGEVFQPTTPPPELDWELWLGQAPLTEYMPKRCHFDFRWWYEYGGGMMTDWGAHHVDIAQWAAAPDLPGPVTIEPVSVRHPVPLDAHGQPTLHNQFNTAREFNVLLTFANGLTMSIVDKSPKIQAVNGILFEGEKGTLFVNRETRNGAALDELKDKPLPKGMVPSIESLPIPHERHMVDFIECCKTRRAPRSDVWSHHRSLTTCHLANIALRLNRKLRWDATAQEIVGDAEANGFQSRAQRKGYELA